MPHTSQMGRSPVGVGCFLLCYQTAHAASCVPVKAEQEAAFGNPYWLSGYYLNSLMHPHPHPQYPEVQLTWNPYAGNKTLTGYKVVAEGPYTTDGSLSQSLTTLAKMPLYVTVGKDTRQVRMPNLASQFRTWSVYARFDNGSLSGSPIASTEIVCGQDVIDGGTLYIELVDEDGTPISKVLNAFSASDWRDYGCHYYLPDEYARGVNPNEIGGTPAHYPFTGSWNWGEPVVGPPLVDDVYDVEGFELFSCDTPKPTTHLAVEWDITPITFTPGEAVPCTPTDCNPVPCNTDECPVSTVDQCREAHEDDDAESLCPTLASSLTGYQGSLTACRGSLTACRGSLTGCQGSLTGCQGSLTGCQGSLTGCQGSLTGCQGFLTACQDECRPTECPEVPWTVGQCQAAYSDGSLCPTLFASLTDCQESLTECRDESADFNPPPDVNTPNPPGGNTPDPPPDKSGGGDAGASRDDHGNTPAQATVVSLGAQEPGQIDTVDDIDYFTVPLPYAGVLMVETTGPTATVGTVWQHGVELTGADSDDGQQNFQLSVPVEADPVVIAVAGKGQQTGRYDLQTALVAGALENPGPDSFQSGIGVLSGWVCEAEFVEIEINGETHPAAYGTERLDTAGRKDGTQLCGDIDNGFGLLFNWNLLGAGEHEVVALVDGVELDRATVTVTTLGAEFLQDAAGECMVEDFPTAGQLVTLEWQQTSQNFVITDLE